ncbi:hypothetical protein VTJ04DRAFT_10906 [Mycothermus thermophilus]|uniref:uncharacterized protein n=1 Tax=Humicola insolens TaxID=85995 RepID=UPI003742633A
MVTFNIIYTAPINPAGVSPRLTLAQVWEGLRYKVRRPERFVPVITSCEILSSIRSSSSSSNNNNNNRPNSSITADKTSAADTSAPGTTTAANTGSNSGPDGDQDGPEEVITRRVTFHPDSAPKKKTVVEVCKLYPPRRVDFVQEDGTVIQNFVGDGPEGEMFLTYAFEWRVPGVAEGEDKKRVEEGFWRTAKMAVEGSIDTIRAIAKGEMTMD